MFLYYDSAATNVTRTMLSNCNISSNTINTTATNGAAYGGGLSLNFGGGLYLQTNVTSTLSYCTFSNNTISLLCSVIKSICSPFRSFLPSLPFSCCALPPPLLPFCLGPLTFWQSPLARSSLHHVKRSSSSPQLPPLREERLPVVASAAPPSRSLPQGAWFALWRLRSARHPSCGGRLQ